MKKTFQEESEKNIIVTMFQDGLGLNRSIEYQKSRPNKSRFNPSPANNKEYVDLFLDKVKLDSSHYKIKMTKNKSTHYLPVKQN